MKHIIKNSKLIVSRFFSGGHELESIPPEVRREVHDHISERRAQTNRWFIMARFTIGLSLVGYLSIDAVRSIAMLPESLIVVLVYLFGSLCIWVMTIHHLSSVRWWNVLLDLAFILVLRHYFLFEAMVDPNATMVALFTLILISYTAYSDPDMSRSIAIITLLATAGTLAIDLVQANVFGSEAYLFRLHPLRIVLLMTYLGASCLVSYLLASRLQKQLLSYGIELQKRLQTSIANAFERKRREKLEELNRLKQNFILVLSHELRTPIAPLRSSIEIVRAELDQHSDAAEILNIALESTKKLQRLVQDYTQLAELLTLDRNFVTRRNIRLSSLVMAVKKCLKYSFIFCNDLDDLVVTADPHLLGHALLAILRRAELVSSGNAPITINGVSQNSVVHLSIHDPDSLIDSDIASTLDDIFTTNTERTFHSHNTGIELILAKHAIHRMGGQLQVNSAPTMGTTVTCTLPAEQHGVQWLDNSQLQCEVESLAVQVV